MIRARLIPIVLVGVLGGVLLGGCAGKGNETPNFTSGLGTPDSSATPTAGATSGAPTPATSTKSTQAAPTYPNNAKEYGQALMTAWGKKDNNRVELLSTSASLAQLNGQAKGLDSRWTYVTCDGSAGTERCTYRNGNGDDALVGVTGQYLGQPHAAGDVQIFKTLYYADAVGYATTFAQAYAAGNTQRMGALSSSTVVNQAKSVDKIESASYFPDGAADSTYVQVSGLGPDLGKSYYVKITNDRLGRSHAITCVGKQPTDC